MALGRRVPAIQRPLRTRDAFVAVFGHAPTSYAAAVAAGFSRGELDAAVRRGLLERPRRGQLLAPDFAETRTDPRARHAELVSVAVRSSRVPLVVTHESAALLHGIATPAEAVPRSVSLLAVGASGRRGIDERRRTAPLPIEEQTCIDGVTCTSVARTAVDLARGRALPSALIPLDSAARLLIAQETGASGNHLRALVRDPDLRSWAATRLAHALSSCFGWAGTVAVRTALMFVDPCSESPLESRSRGWFLEAGLGGLDPGTPIEVGGTTYWADFCDRDRRIVGEADGWSKYGSTDSDVRRALRKERERSDALQDGGWRLVRWTSTHTRLTVVRRMTSALTASPP